MVASLQAHTSSTRVPTRSSFPAFRLPDRSPAAHRPANPLPLSYAHCGHFRSGLFPIRRLRESTSICYIHTYCACDAIARAHRLLPVLGGPAEAFTTGRELSDTQRPAHFRPASFHIPYGAWAVAEPRVPRPARATNSDPTHRYARFRPQRSPPFALFSCKMVGFRTAVSVAQRQSIGLWLRGSGVQIPSLTPIAQLTLVPLTPSYGEVLELPSPANR